MNDKQETRVGDGREKQSREREKVTISMEETDHALLQESECNVS